MCIDRCIDKAHITARTHNIHAPVGWLMVPSGQSFLTPGCASMVKLEPPLQVIVIVPTHALVFVGDLWCSLGLT